MNQRPRSPIILVANNPFGHHLLTSQLLDVYQSLELDTDVLLLCNGITAGADTGTQPWLNVQSFGTRFGGVFSYFNLIFKLIALRFTRPNAVFHLRGFVAGALFCASRLCLLGSARYIYDPRGAFFIEWREAGRPMLASRLFGWFEARLIGNSLATIVTSDGFRRLYQRLFGYSGKYLTIYNATGFAFRADKGPIPAKGPVRLVYLGTFNHWHDMDEVCRVMASAARHIGPERTEISIYTSAKFHDLARATFGKIECAALTVDYVNYRDIPATLADKHIGVSVVRPTLSTRIASPIKIGDYVANGLLPLLNSGIGDFDAHYRAENSAVLYRFGQEVDMTRLDQVSTAPNKQIYDQVSSVQSRTKLAPVVERLRHG